MPILVTITGPIAAGKNTVADLLAQICVQTCRTVVVADVDDVAFMVPPAARTSSLWLAAHRAHGALVGAWMRSDIDVVIAVGPIYDQEEQEALYGQLPVAAHPCRVLIDAPVAVTWQRAAADTSRGASREETFHRALMPGTDR